MNTIDRDIELMRARQQRDQALACAVLSLIITLALLIWSIEPDHGTAAALESVRRHRDLLAQNESVLRNNQAVLAVDLIALEGTSKSQQRSPR